ncbi:GNAT family N-acetyltransferase [Nocardioides sp. AX2bis]|uniref:GNAT family N-acetyltransferase n=1 Tax=Nocardioides sp. AX2bis TaxID=2653157 RepID=UPI0012F2ACE8|nr:GNAT family N-acetyltransferase [Nocardioides sp. AX2bis]VXB64644.1 GNAT family N-acetyltransferase [Nocardioides sp. AX2bis]
MSDPDGPDLTALAWPRATERLRLRPLLPADVPALHRYRSRDDVAFWLGAAAGTPEDLAARFLGPGRAGRTLVVEHDDVVVGDLMLRVQDGWAQAEVAGAAGSGEAELGWVLDPAYGGRGLATEAVRALLDVAFDGLGVRRVTASCFAANVASWRLMERVGMRREAEHVADSLHRELGWLDGLVYALLAEERRS